MALRRDLRVRNAVVVTVCLSLQRIMLNAYAWTMTIPLVAPAATNEKCAIMGAERNHPPTEPCEKHCSSDSTSEARQNRSSGPPEMPT